MSGHYYLLTPEGVKHIDMPEGRRNDTIARDRAREIAATIADECQLALFYRECEPDVPLMDLDGELVAVVSTDLNTCETCRHFMCRPNYQAECRRWPPVVGVAQRWPTVEKDDWCGEFAPAEWSEWLVEAARAVR